MADPFSGKMFGVLLAEAADGTRVCLRAFSGKLAGRWLVDGFVPPMFDANARARVEGPGEARISALSREHAALAARIAMHPPVLEAMRARHRRNKAERRMRREREPGEVLDNESRRDHAEKKRYLLSEAHQSHLRDRRRLAALTRLRRLLSAELMRQIHATYIVRNALGEQRPLRALYASEPPSGAGDCAAPKLIAHAHANGLRPLALVEMFYGEGSRRSGVRYPPCPTKCEPLLAFMAPEMLHASTWEEPRLLFEDEAILVLEKPAAMPSVPGKRGRGSALAWVQQLAPGSLLAHRLDEDTSGLLLAAKTPEAHRALQAQFARREVKKRYVAWVEGELTGKGEITLPLRLDPDDRPRQCVDPLHGKPAHTRWEVVDRVEGFTRLHLFPTTGRSHQLRVHTASGLEAPIVGDRLYGSPDERLLLHADEITFLHPLSARALTFRSPAPF